MSVSPRGVTFLWRFLTVIVLTSWRTVLLFRIWGTLLYSPSLTFLIYFCICVVSEKFNLSIWVVLRSILWCDSIRGVIFMVGKVDTCDYGDQTLNGRTDRGRLVLLHYPLEKKVVQIRTPFSFCLVKKGFRYFFRSFLNYFP